jgi:PAS domain-containing protein
VTKRREINRAPHQRKNGPGQRAIDASAMLAARNRELTAAESFLEDLIAASPSMIFRIDPGQIKITYASPNVGWLLGYETAEIIGVRNIWRRMIHRRTQHHGASRFGSEETRKEGGR